MWVELPAGMDPVRARGAVFEFDRLDRRGASATPPRSEQQRLGPGGDKTAANGDERHAPYMRRLALAQACAFEDSVDRDRGGQEPRRQGARGACSVERSHKLAAHDDACGNDSAPGDHDCHCSGQAALEHNQVPCPRLRGIVLFLVGETLLVVLVVMAVIVMVVMAILPGWIVGVPVVMPEATRSERRHRRGENEGYREAGRVHAPTPSTARANVGARPLRASTRSLTSLESTPARPWRPRC